jgi:hypothetical protein
MKPTKHCLKKWEGWKMIKGIQWGESLFKVHWTHL